jgi:hypothetical protein
VESSHSSSSKGSTAVQQCQLLRQMHCVGMPWTSIVCSALWQHHQLLMYARWHRDASSAKLPAVYGSLKRELAVL